MALNSSALSSQLQSAMYGIDDATSAITTFGNTIASYITANALITYSWVGTNPSTGATDPTVTFTASLTGSLSLTSPSDINDLARQLTTGILSWTLTADDVTFALALALNPSGAITIVMNNEDSFASAMDSISSQIVSTFQTFLNTTPVTGSHSAFTGTATMASIA